MEIQQSLLTNQTALEHFYREVKSNCFGHENEQLFRDLQQYLNGEISEVPVVPSAAFDMFANLPKVLNPFRNWLEVDHRIIGYITRESWSINNGKDGFLKSFYEWLSNQILDFPDDENLFEDVIEFLKKYRRDEYQKFLRRETKLTDATLTQDKKLTSLGHYLLKHSDTLLEEVIKSKINLSFLGVFALYNFDSLLPYIDQMTKIEEYEGKDGNRHIPRRFLDILARYQPSKFEHKLRECITTIDCQSCKAETARILIEYCGPANRNIAFSITKDTLDYISKRKKENIRISYDFLWPKANKFYQDNTPEYIDWIFTAFGQEAKEIVAKYVEDTTIISLKVIEVAIRHLGQEALDIAAEALNLEIKSNDNAAHFRQTFNLLSNLDYSKYHDEVWEIAKSEFEKVSETACIALSKLPTEIVTPKAIDLLQEKKSHIRKAGARLLSLIRTAVAEKALEQLLTTETDDEVRGYAVNLIYAKPVTITMDEAKRRIEVATDLKKLGKPLLKWLDESKLPAMQWTDGELLGENATRYLLYRQKAFNEIGHDLEARDIYPLIDKASAHIFATALLESVLQNGGFKAPNKFAITLVGIFCDDSVIATITEIAIKDKNLNACACLGLMNSMTAALALEKIIQTFKVKYPNVREAAEDAFDSVAERMGLTVYELKDKMIPDFGFRGLTKSITVGGATYTVSFSAALQMVYHSVEGKVVKTLKWSEPEKKEQKEQSALLRDTKSQLKNNLEYYMVTQRKWPMADWKRFFLQNPLANAFAKNFVWGIIKQNQLTATFYLSGHKLLDIEDVEVDLDEKDKIVLVHPLMIEETNDEWRSKLKAINIEPPFAQLNREVFKPDGAEMARKISYTFENKSMEGQTFKSRAYKFGWRRGSVIDSGVISSYRRSFDTLETDVFIMLDGLSVIPFESEITFKEFFFVKQGSVDTGSYVYDEPRNEKDHRLIKFGDVNPIVYSETLYDLQRILQTETNQE